jgi:hypothetical protein
MAKSGRCRALDQAEAAPERRDDSAAGNGDAFSVGLPPLIFAEKVAAKMSGSARRLRPCDDRGMSLRSPRLLMYPLLHPDLGKLPVRKTDSGGFLLPLSGALRLFGAFCAILAVTLLLEAAARVPDGPRGPLPSTKSK